MLTHHAQLIEGNEATYNALLQEIETSLGLKSGHPDLITFSYPNEKLGIDHAHLIHDALLKYPAMSKNLVVAVYAHTITDQAQNALLKICEEPPKHSRIFLVTDFLPHILPTLRSRFVIFDLKKIKNNTNGDITSAEAQEEPKFKSKKVDMLSAENFLNIEIDKRLALVKDIHTALDKDQISISAVWSFVSQLEALVMGERNLRGAVDQHIYTDKLQAIADAQKFMHSPGNSVKMLLEFLAIRL